MTKTKLLTISLLGTALSAYAQGPLTPPGAPAPTMKTLTQIEPRTAITNAPFYIGQPGSYYLAAPVAAGGFDAITIDSDDVTLDLNGFTINGAGTHRGIYIRDNRKHIVIRNGRIRNCFVGILVQYGQDMVIERVTLSGNRDGLALEALGDGPCEGVVVRDSAIVNNLDNGVTLRIYPSDATMSGHVFERVQIARNGDYGVYMTAFPGMAITDVRFSACVISSNRLHGVYGELENSALIEGFRFEGNILAQNGQSGIYLGSGASGSSVRANEFIGNTFRRNSGYGLYLREAYGNLMDGNRASGNGLIGLRTDGEAAANFYFRNIGYANTSGLMIGSPNDVYGPILTGTGPLSDTGNESHPWANFAP